MSDNIKIDIISDVMCPWCLIGYKRLEKAISEMGIADRVEIEWQPFELNPGLPPEGENLLEHLVRKYGISESDGIGFQGQMKRLGAELGFTFDFHDGMTIVNTRDAHILLDFARGFGKQTELKLRLFEAFFEEQKDISDRAILRDEVQRVGLNADQALARLDEPAARKRTEEREAHWHGHGVTSVPTMIFNRSNTLIGAQPVSVYKEALAGVIESASPGEA